MTLVSVIIPTYNRASLLKQAIESVLAAEQEGIDLEIIVVDDGSTDDTPQLVQQYPVVYLRQRGGLGSAETRNIGIDAAHGEFITFLDDDDVWLPTKLTTHLRLFEAHPEYGMVLAQLWYTDRSLNERTGPHPPDPQPAQWDLTNMLRYDSQVAAVMIRRSVAQQVRFDRFFRRMQDWDWFLRVVQYCPVGYSNVPVMLFRTRPRSTPELWMFYRYTAKVFHRNTRVLNVSTRLKMQPVLWAYRGLYTWDLLKNARRDVQQRNYLQAARALGYAVLISPPHLGLLLARFAKARLTRSRSAPAPQPLEG